VAYVSSMLGCEGAPVVLASHTRPMSAERRQNAAGGTYAPLVVIGRSAYLTRTLVVAGHINAPQGLPDRWHSQAPRMVPAPV
jgi:hypothetical protein